MFKNIVKTGLVCLMLTLFTTGSSLAAEVKIGVMDVQRVLIQSQPGINAKAAFDKKKAEIEAKLLKEQEAIESLQQEIEKKGSVWSQEKKDEKLLEFKKMRRDLQTKSEDARGEMKLVQDKELEPILKALEEVVEKFRETNGYTVILDSKVGVISFSPDADVSEALIQELNAAMKQ